MELRTVIGPPGTGKTTWLSRQAARAVERFGNEGALVVSLTKAAAAEAGSRDTGLAEHMVGTLHSHAFRALGSPDVIERKHLERWNQEHPALRIAHAGDDERDETGRAPGADRGTQLLEELDLLRARRTPPALWPATVRGFASKWEAFKAEAGAIDFSDMIEQALERVPLPPHRPSVIFADEAQDLSRLEVELLRRWTAHVEHTVLIGDPAQALYGWRGADPSVLAGDPFVVLAQSYRVPAAVHAEALRLIRRSSSWTETDYHHTPQPGQVRRVPLRWRDPEAIIPTLEEELAAGRRVMILAACAFMLSPLCAALRDAGIPYGNPYADRWNPLTAGPDKVSTRDRVLAFVRAESLADVKAFAPLLKSREGDGPGALVHGAKKRLEALPDDLDPAEAAAIVRASFTPEALAMLRRDVPIEPALEWLERSIVPAKQAAARYVLRIARRRGVAALKQEPRVVVGTIHSVKGGEAETVLVFPDLSLQGYAEYQRPGWVGRDSIFRLFYVALTRARERVLVGEPSGGFFAPL